MTKRPDLAEKKRLVRAKAAARRDLELRGLIAYEILGSPSDIIAIDPDTGRARIIRVCPAAPSRRDAKSLSRRGGVQVECWSREPGKKGFQITKA